MDTIWDQHLHCAFSGDSDALPEEMVQKAKMLGLPGITFTDHLDFDYREEPHLFDLDLSAYQDTIRALQNTTGEIHLTKNFTILCGIELGLQPHVAQENQAALNTGSFDFVIGSIHVVGHRDPYYPSYFEGRSYREAYQEYFDEILENIKKFSNFDTLGHLDYVKRYGIKCLRQPTTSPSSDTKKQHMASLSSDTEKEASCMYNDYQETIDEILRFLIHHDKALEVNTGSLRYGYTFTHPSNEILARYKELGGKLLTIGSDAHKPQDMANGFSSLPQMLREIGFSTYYIYKKRSPIELPLPG